MGKPWKSMEIYGKSMGNLWKFMGNLWEVYGILDGFLGNLNFLGGSSCKWMEKSVSIVHVFHIFRVFFRAQLEGFFADPKIGA